MSLPLHFVRDGEETMSYLKGAEPFGNRNEHPLPKVLLLDLKMPLRDGFEVLEWVRSQPGLRRMVVVVFTSSDLVSDVRRAFDLGANSYLVKPNRLEGLEERAVPAAVTRYWVGGSGTTTWGGISPSPPLPHYTGWSTSSGGARILATDADVDGLHIRNLLITCFLRFFPDLITQKFVYILETPLFRVRDKKVTHYCYSEAERDKVREQMRNPEVTRFKGLGEISPSEFKHFINAKMRLTPVTVDDAHAIQPLLQFYMGKNTPQRREYIMEHLVLDSELLAG